MTKLLKIAAFIVPACATLALAQPAFATDGSTGGGSAAVAAAASASGQAKDAQAKKYCLNVIPDTASRVARRVCKTKAEWADEDIDLGARK